MTYGRWLRSNPEVAVEYGRLKARLAELHRYDHDAYTDEKTEFIEAILAKAST